MPKKEAQADWSLKVLVGAHTYGVWVDMLRRLVPHGRTHRLSPMVTGMLHYSSGLAYEKFVDTPLDDSPAAALLSASETGDVEEAVEYLHELLENLFADAGVESIRTSSRGDQYSVVENSIEEFVRWYDMPWE